MPNFSSYDCLKFSQLGSLIFWILKHSFKGPKHNVFDVGWPMDPWEFPKIIKKSETLILTYKYSSYAFNQNPS